MSWWDDDARQMFEDGFFKRRDLESSVIKYADEMGVKAYPTKKRASRAKKRSDGPSDPAWEYVMGRNKDFLK